MLALCLLTESLTLPGNKSTKRSKWIWKHRMSGLFFLSFPGWVGGGAANTVAEIGPVFFNPQVIPWDMTAQDKNFIPEFFYSYVFVTNCP